MRNPGRLFPISGQFSAWVLCGVAFLGCTDIESLEEQLHATSDAGPEADGALPMGGSGGAQNGGSGGAAGAPGGGTGGVVGGQGSGGQGGAGMTASCVPGSEGCACAAGACSAELVCVDAMCLRVVCGDARRDPGEECDDGNGVETDACTSECLDARCGDGLLHAEVEQCDDANSDDEDSCSNACEKHYNIAFVTSTTYTVSSLGGLAGADAACATRATAAGLPGNFVAWLNTEASPIATRLEGARGWVRPDGKPFLDEVDNPATFYPPSLTELGDVVAPDGPPAAGGYASGASGNECEDWTSVAGDAYFLVGDPTSGTGSWNGGWTSAPCSSPFRIYCMQRDFDSALSFEPAEGRLAFVSNLPWTPAGGLAAADARCNQDALDAGLPGTFKALLATSSASAASRFSTEGETWVRRDGIPIVAEAADLFVADGRLLAPLQVTAFGNYLGNYGGWSGSADPNQAGGSSTCNDWTSSLDSVLGTSGRVFFGSVSNMLGFDADEPCDGEFVHLYCLEAP